MSCLYKYEGKWYTETELAELHENLISQDSTLEVAKRVKEIVVKSKTDSVYSNSDPMAVLQFIGDQLSTNYLATLEQMLDYDEKLAQTVLKLTGKDKDDVQFQLSSLVEEADESLKRRLIDFLKPLGVTVEHLDTLMDRTGVDAIGASDIINKIVLINKGKEKLDTLPEETAHFFVALLGRQHPLVKTMMSKIEQWEGYEKVVRDYTEIYKGDKEKIKEEAIGKIISQFIVSKKDVQKNFLHQVAELIRQALKLFDVNWLSVEDIAEDIAIDILSNNYSKIKRTLPPGSRLVEYESSLEKDPEVKDLVTRLKNAGFLLTGSLALRAQGTVYRTPEENIHDIDFRIPRALVGTWKEVAEKALGKPINIFNQFTNKSLGVTYNTQVGNIGLDFFVVSSNSSRDGMASWESIFEAKLGFGREKDSRDFLTFVPKEKTKGFNFPSEVFFQVDNSGLVSKLDETSAKIAKKDLLNGDNAYFIGDKQVSTRVTTLVKKNAGDKFKNRKPDPLTQAKEEQFKEWGSKGHRDMELLIGRYLTPEGKVVKSGGQLVRQNNTPVQSELDPTNRGLFDTMHEYVVDLLLSYPDNTTFKTEQMIYSDRGGKPGERDIAGTMDFIAIQPDGKVDILDWKFRRLYKDSAADEDIPWYLISEWNMQMLEYKKILKREYGLKDVNFGKTRMIPISLTYTGIKTNNGTKFIPDELDMATADLKVEGKSYLLPVPTPDESTGDTNLDSLIHRLTELYNTIKDIPAPDRQKNIKNEQLNNLFKAIRHLQVARNFNPLTEQIGILIKDSERVIKEHKGKFENITDLTEKQISDEASNLLLKAQALHIYQNLATEFRNFYGENPTADEIEILAKLTKVTSEANTAYANINDIVKDFGQKYISSRRGVEDLLSKEKSVTGITRNFNTTSELPPAAMQTLYLMVDNANNKIQFDLNDAKDELVALKKDIDKWGGLKKALPLIKKKDKNTLIDEYDSEFYEELREAVENSDLDWIKDNIDMDAFKKHLKTKYKEIKQAIEETRYSYDDLQNEDKKRQALEKLALTTDPTKLEAYFEEGQYYTLKKFPLDKWKSDEYKTLQQNPPVLKFYEFIREWNQKAKEIGYLDRTQADRNFLPYLYKSFSEKINLGGEFSFGDWLVSSISIDENVAGYGKFNPLTEQIEDSIPIYFTSKIDNPEQVSEELFVNIAAYVKAIVNYDYKSQIDGQVKALYFIEQNKGSLRVNTFSNLIKVNGLPVPQETNNQNADLLLNHIKSLQYGQKYTNVESTDALLGDFGKGFNKFSDAVKAKLGFSLGHIAEGKDVSLTRLMDTFNRVFTIKNMGLNVATSASVFAGGNFQAIINSGKYYTKEQFLASEFQHAAHKVFKNDKVHLALIKSFMPIDEELQREINQLSSGKLTGNSFGDFMMFMMRKADHIVQYANFLSFMKNTIVIDGKLYNAREYYRNSPEYANRYNLPATERKELESIFESKVKELLDKQGITELANIDDKGKLTITGIPNIKNDNLFSYRSLIISVGKRATGNVSPENEMLIRMNAVFRSMLVFKNWIPGLVKQRVGGLRHDANTGYEYGRLRMLIKHLGPLALFKAKTISDILKANDSGVEKMKEYFKNQKESYANKTNKELDMTEAEFMDMFRQNLRGQLKELFILVSMIALVTAILPMFKPDDDEEVEIKNRFKFASRLMDKIKDEVWFYYNPVGLQQILNGSIFPALGLFTDLAKVVSSVSTEIYGATTGDEELTEKNFVIKNIMRSLPLAKEMTYYIAMFDADLAKELGIQISSQSRLK